MPISFACAELALPAFAAVMGSTVSVTDTVDPLSFLGFVGITLIVGLLAGSYPAFILSGFQAVDTLKGGLHLKTSNAGFRNILVVMQFTTAITLIVITVVISNQLEYCRNRQLGIDKEQVLLISNPLLTGPEYALLQQRFLQQPGIQSVAISSEAPSAGGGGSQITAEVGYEPRQVELPLFISSVNYGFLDTYGIELLAGRNFSSTFPSDLTKATIVNESAAHRLGYSAAKDAVGQPLALGDWSGVIIGVAKDFHYDSLHQPVSPTSLRLYIDPSAYVAYVAVKFHSDDIAGTLALLEREWRDLLQNRPFAFSFLGDAFDNLYREEERQSRTVIIFSSLAVFLACWGSLGLVSFAIERRRKEIGIRKAIGASISNIVLLLSKDFLKLLVISNLIAWPIGYYLIHKWLQNFAYQVDLGLGSFLLSGTCIIVLALTTISYHTIKAATANPVDALKYK